MCSPWTVGLAAYRRVVGVEPLEVRRRRVVALRVVNAGVVVADHPLPDVAAAGPHVAQQPAGPIDVDAGLAGQGELRAQYAARP